MKGTIFNIGITDLKVSIFIEKNLSRVFNEDEKIIISNPNRYTKNK